LIQLPILIGLYGVIRNPTLYVFSEAEYALVSKSFLWVKDLTISTFQTYAETGFSAATFLSLIIPLTAIIFTIIQQEQTSKNMPQQQGQKSMLILTIAMIGYMTLSYQQALGLYWALQTVIGVAMTVVMFKFFPVSLEEMEKKAAEKERIARAKNPNKFIEQRKAIEQGNNDSNKKTQKDYIQQRPKK
jgi:membrane protein insertase Oxa1/YidC/SpoIIIJ